MVRSMRVPLVRPPQAVLLRLHATGEAALPRAGSCRAGPHGFRGARRDARLPEAAGGAVRPRAAGYTASRGDAFHSRDDIEKQVKKLGKEQAHYDEQATAFGLTPRQREIARKKSEKLEMEMAQLNADLRKMSVIPLPSKPGMVAAFAATLAILDRMKTFAEKREFIEATVERITTNGHQVNVTGAFDIAAIENKGGKGGIYSIRNLNARLRYQNVRGFQVSMSDGLAVGRFERTGQLYRQP